MTFLMMVALSKVDQKAVEKRVKELEQVQQVEEQMLENVQKLQTARPGEEPDWAAIFAKTTTFVPKLVDGSFQVWQPSEGTMRRSEFNEGASKTMNLSDATQFHP